MPSDNTVPNLDILLLCDRPSHISSNVFQHLDALSSTERHTVYELPIIGDISEELDLNRFDAIIIHYTLVLCSPSYVSMRTLERLAAFRGVKAVFIQDEYRFINKTIDALKAIDADILFTCVPPQEFEQVYPSSALPGLTKVNVLTGYIDEALLALTPPALKDRSIDVGYRARNVPFWLGEMGREKWRIGQIFKRDAARYGLNVDISYREEERLYGQDWTDFLQKCKAVLGVESGSSVFDFSGEIQAAVTKDVLDNPDISFDEIREKHFKSIEGKIYLNQISPRCFEAAALKTLQILYEGEYSGRMEPWRHYIPLKKDHRNMDEVVAVLRDTERCQNIVDTAYNEVALNPLNRFETHVRDVMGYIDAAWKRRGRAKVHGYARVEFDQRSRLSGRSLWRKRKREVFTWVYFFLFKRLLGFLPEGYRDVVHRKLSKILKAVNRLRRRD